MTGPTRRGAGVKLLSCADQKNNLVLAVLAKANEPMGPTAIARQLEADNTHWWEYSPFCRFVICSALARIKAVKHPGGKYTSPLSA